MAKQKKIADFQKHAEELKQLLAKADKEELKKALKSGTPSEVCKILGISEKKLNTMLKKGHRLAFNLLTDLFKR